MSFQERFNLLIADGQANEQSVAATRAALAMVEEHYGLQLSEELGAPLANHLAVTMKRLLDGETLMETPDVVWQELRDYPEELALAASIVAGLEKILNVPIMRDELGFIAVHLCKIRIESAILRRSV
jgi:transcriptional regulatory protein LevR